MKRTRKVDNPPGPRPMDPVSRLRDTAIEYGVAIEYEGGDRMAYRAGVRLAWDRLRKAAIAYRDGPRRRGRPECSPDRIPGRRARRAP